MKARNALLIVTGLSFLALNGCATTRMRGNCDRASDQVQAKQSSYRIRGTDTTGYLSDAQVAQLQSKTRAWRWPTNYVTVTSKFGTRKGEHHDGIDLRAKRGTKVHAAADGKVIYSGSKIRGYGRMIVIRHAGKLSTVYAHNSKLYAKAGQRVRRGQLIALSGNTGRSSGPHLHFEVREGVTAINPMILLPSPAVANEASRRMASEQARKKTVRSTASSVRRSAKKSVRKTQRRIVRRPYRQPKQADSRSAAARVAQGDGFRPKSPYSKRAN